ncbi:ictacalcin-like [Cheilinus undulatus]|uniref:ictacalcin-like n=1 Tax=Cheilinus undulatus TaxID=241271 RepID=UPI001BD28DCE|nr:ictacalcin-like [Cheilinus undulatus]
MSLIQAMEILRNIFDKYAGRDGDAKSLTKAELSELLRNEIPCSGAPSQAALDQFFSNLDSDRDGVVNFTEYVTFVATLTIICNE